MEERLVRIKRANICARRPNPTKQLGQFSSPVLMCCGAAMPERRKTRECFAEGAPHPEKRGQELVDGVAERLVTAGEQAGLTGHDLVALLESGMSVGDLIDYLCLKMQGRPAEN